MSLWGKSDSKEFTNDLWVQNYCEKTNPAPYLRKPDLSTFSAIYVPGGGTDNPKGLPIQPTDINKKRWPFQHSVIQLFFTAVNNPGLQFWQFLSNLFFLALPNEIVSEIALKFDMFLLPTCHLNSALCNSYIVHESLLKTFGGRKCFPFLGLWNYFIFNEAMRVRSLFLLSQVLPGHRNKRCTGRK